MNFTVLRFCMQEADTSRGAGWTHGLTEGHGLVGCQRPAGPTMEEEADRVAWAELGWLRE
jgi:hypothetical protein